MANRFIKNDAGEAILVNEGEFGVVTITVRTPSSYEVQANIIAVNRHGEIEVELIGDASGKYPYAGERSWIRIGDGKCEHPKHWVVGAELTRVAEIYEQNQPVASVTALRPEKTRADGV